ncbi:ribonuclease Y [bacterium]|nr:ribonuclease Y [bacterium]
MLEVLLTFLVTTVGVGGSVFVYANRKQKEESSKKEVEAENKAKKIVLDAEEKALHIKRKSEEDEIRVKKELAEKEKRAEIEKEKANLVKEEYEKKEKLIEGERESLNQRTKQLEEKINEQISKLDGIAGLTKEEAKKIILENTEKSLSQQIGKRIAEAEEKVKTDVDDKARELLVDAMQHGANDYVAEYTVSTVHLPSKDVKGRIIGKEGRNIRSFEEQTGVTLDLDESPEAVRISCFDSVRREIARVSLERLIKDGRVHPARIEEVVAKTREEIDKIMYKEGEKLSHKVGIYNLPPDLIQNLGKYKYRYSYGQNMIEHTLEETKIGTKIAHEIGADVTVTKLACLLHDIGKIFTDKEGSHIELAAEYLAKFDIPKKVIEAVEDHHKDHPRSVEGMIVQIADTISGGRPGARYEDYEVYAKRMTGLEEAALSFAGVDKAYAISAGREVRVMLKADEVDDASAVKLADDIATKIQKENTYPGTVKVTVIREMRAIGVAK